MEVMGGQAELFEMIRALHATRRLARRLNGRQQQGHQNSNDGDDNQQFDEREASCSDSEVNTYVAAWECSDTRDS